MHRIIEGYLATFCEDNFISSKLEESSKFERFVNYCVLRSVVAEEFDIENITTDSVDAGIDGLCFLIDGEVATTFDEAEALLKRPKNTMSVDIFFIQAKTCESYERGEILKFGDGVKDFIQDHPLLPHGDILKEQKRIFDLVLNNISKIKTGRPNAYLKYVCTSTNDIAAEIEATKESIINSIKTEGYFGEVHFDYVGLEGLIKMWEKSRNSISAIIPVKAYSPYPEMEGISEAYLAVVPLKKYVETVLMGPDGRMQPHIFEENVRAFLGKQNPVNKQIFESLQKPSSQAKFGILNNGITIISPDVRVQNDRISVSNYQIVNGCQTSTVLYENYALLKDKGTITVKIVEATDLDVISEVVRATNSQSKVEETQFLSYEAIVRRIEKYFESTEDIQNKETKLYFERRNGQFRNAGIAKRRIFTIQETFRAVGAMFLKNPEMAYRYPTKMIGQNYDKLVNSKNKEIIYYTAALALYRFKLLASNGRIDSKYNIYKWHILMILVYVGNKGKKISTIQNKKIEPFCNKLIALCSQPDEDCLALFKEATDVIEAVGFKSSRDEIRTATYTQSIISYCEKNYR